AAGRGGGGAATETGLGWAGSSTAGPSWGRPGPAGGPPPPRPAATAGPPRGERVAPPGSPGPGCPPSCAPPQERGGGGPPPRPPPARQRPSRCGEQPTVAARGGGWPLLASPSLASPGSGCSSMHCAVL